MSKVKSQKSKAWHGFTIIEAMVVIFIFALITVTFYSLFSAGTRYIIESKNRLGAIAVANERMEVVRSLDYNQIGTTDGYISGDIPSYEQLTVSGKTFFIFSSVQYIDDPFDGQEDGSPDDTRPNDYKRVGIKVAWENDINTIRASTLVSDFAPPGVEESIGGGTLIVKVLNKKSEGIQDATVHIENSGLGISENFMTDSNGGISLSGVPADGNDYEITISKNGYFPISSLPTYPTTSFYPTYAHASVTDGAKNIYSITTDKTSNITLNTADFFGTTINNIGYNLAGGIRKGDTLDDPPDNPTSPIYYYDENLNSGSNGENNISDVSYGTYTFSFTGSSSNYEFIKMSPYDSTLNNKNKFSVEPGINSEVTAIFADKNVRSALLTILDSSNSLPIKEASVRLFNLALPTPYDVTLNTDEFGMVFFPESLPELESATYDIEVKTDGYQDKSDAITVTNLAKKEIQIDPE
jgi:type II secretory pathway pseudopilin PulG